MKIIIEIDDEDSRKQIEDLDENYNSFSEYLHKRMIYICNEYNINARISIEE